MKKTIYDALCVPYPCVEEKKTHKARICFIIYYMNIHNHVFMFHLYPCEISCCWWQKWQKTVGEQKYCM